MIFNANNIKKFFILTAYGTYLGSTVIENHYELNLRYYNYIFVGIIGICLKIANNTEVIEKIIHDVMPPEEIQKIHQQLNSIIESSSNPSSIVSEQIIQIPDMNRDINEPYTPNNSEDVNITHRDYVLANGQIIRLKL